MKLHTKSAPTVAEQQAEIEAWKNRPQPILAYIAASKRSDYFRMLEARKAGKTPLYVSLVSGKAFHWDGSYR